MIRHLPRQQTVVYYAAASLDGFIASADGGVKWLAPFEQSGMDHGYAKFYESVDSLVMGSRTYEQALGFGDWPHPGKPCWVVTRRSLKTSNPDVHIWSGTIPALMAEILTRGCHHTWLVGGARLAASFRDAQLITDYCVSVVPVLLGAGIPLLDARDSPEPLELCEVVQFSTGIVQLWYQV